jgi:multidrug efflux pump subunit AcrA (membrane-fusion protein)
MKAHLTQVNRLKQRLIKSGFLEKKRMLPIIAISGLFITLLIINLQPKLTHNLTERPSVTVNYIEAIAQKIKPEIIGFGTIIPDLDLKAKAEVSGRIVYIHPKLKKGEIFAKNTLLLKIDDKDYILQLKQAKADLLASKANLTEMQLSIENNQLELALSNEKLNVRQTEFDRKKELSAKGLVSKSNFDTEKQNLLLQKQEVLKLKNLQTTLPSQLEVIKAKVDIANINVEKSQRDLARTQIKLPFNGRISLVHTELDQYILKNAAIFDAVGLEKVLINAQFPLDQFSLFARNFNREKLDFSQADSIPSMENILKSLNLSVFVEDAGGEFSPWQAKVERLSDNLDPLSKTVGVIVSISNSYQKMQPGSRPPLLQGMYMKITLQGSATNFVAIPRFAMHQQQLYLIDKSNELQRIDIKNQQYKGGLLLLKEIINQGDKIITSELFPVVNGMSVTPILDQESQQQMQIWLSSGATNHMNKSMSESQ